MRRFVPRMLLALAPVALAACASSSGGAVADSGAEASADAAASGAGTVSLTRVGGAVQLTEDPEITHECEFVVHLPLAGTRVSDVNAMRTLRNEAGRQGANLVLLVMESRTTIARAEGYLCAD